MYHVSAQGVDERMINVHSSSSSSSSYQENNIIMSASYTKLKTDLKKKQKRN